MTTKSNIKVFLDNLSTTDKVDILKELYKDISGLGVDGDTQLAHINSFEADLLRSVGGAGTLHMTTGLPQYKGGGGGGAPSSAYQNTSQTTRLSEEAAPFAKDVLTEAQDYYRGIMNQGYQDYKGAISAPQTQEQIDAQAGIKGLVGTGTALQQEALDLYRQQGERFTGDTAQEYMSPYQQAVTDIEKRKSVEDFQENVMPQFESQAVQAGGMSGLGSRAGVQASLLGSDLGTKLGDIQTRGLQSSYMDAQKLFQDQKRREQAQAGAVAQLGPASFGQGLAEQGAIQTVGEQRQALAQSALDEQYYKYLEQKAFPEEQLAKYSGFVYGNPLLSERNVKSVASAPGAQGPSFGAQILGAGAGLANTFRGSGGQQAGGANTFGQTRRFAGGGGLSDIVYRENGGQSFYPPIEETERYKGRTAFDRGNFEERRAMRQPVDPEIVSREELIPAGQEVAGGVYAKEIEDKHGPTATEREERQARQAPTISVGGISAEGYSQADTGERYKFDPRYDEVTQRNLAEEREALREGYYTDSDRERGKYRKGTFDRRQDEREEDYARQKELIGEPDAIGTLLDSLARSLLRTRSGDPRDPDSVNTGIFGRVQEGLLESSARLSAGDEARRKELLKLEDKFSKRRSAESEKEFEAEGEDFTRADERKALSLARKFKLEDKILGLPYEKQKQAMAILLSKATLKEKYAKINKLNAEAKAAGNTELSPTETNAVIKMFDNNNTAVFGRAFIDGKPFPVIEEDLNKARQASLKIANSQGLEAANQDYMTRAKRIKDAYAAGKYDGNTPGEG